MQKTSFCIGIYSVWWPSTFLQKAKKTKKCRQNEGRFSRGLSTPLFHRFWSILASILGGFWAPKSEKTRFGEVRKNAKKKELRLTQKVTQVTQKSMRGVQARAGGSLTSIHPGVPRPPSGASEQGRLTHYDHTTACLEGTVADYTS